MQSHKTFARSICTLYNVCLVHRGDIMMHVGSTSWDVQYIGGYHEYIGGCSVHRGYHEYIRVFNKN